MSTLRVNQIQDTNNKIILNNTGSILQVVNANTIGLTGEITTTSAAYVTTGLSVSITPISASSKLYVEFIGNSKFNGGAGDDGVAFKIYRDGVAINTVKPVSTDGGDSLFYRPESNGNNNHGQLAVSHLVDANSTATTTFTLFFGDQWGGTGVVSRDWGANQFTVMEIVA
jgi:hypothetical protein